MDILNSIYVKTKNEIYARRRLSTRSQHFDKSIEEYFRELCELAKDCYFQAATADENRNEAIRDLFISGLVSAFIRLSLLENRTLVLKTAYEQAKTLDTARRNSKLYMQSKLIASTDKVKLETRTKQ